MGQSVGSSWDPMNTPLLDARKYPGDSRNTKPSQKKQNSDWMAYRPSPALIQVSTKQATVNVHITELNGSISDEKNEAVPQGVTHYEHK